MRCASNSSDAESVAGRMFSPVRDTFAWMSVQSVIKCRTSPSLVPPAVVTIT